jgi:hypothetical protein
MRITIPPLHGVAVQDERQLDGSRHLTVDLADPGGDWACSLQGVLDRGGALHEAELELDTPDGPWSGALAAVERVRPEPPLRLLAIFEDAGFGIRLDLQESDDDGGFLARLEPRDDAPGDG